MLICDLLGLFEDDEATVGEASFVPITLKYLLARSGEIGKQINEFLWPDLLKS